MLNVGRHYFARRYGIRPGSGSGSGDVPATSAMKAICPGGSGLSGLVGNHVPMRRYGVYPSSSSGVGASGSGLVYPAGALASGICGVGGSLDVGQTYWARRFGLRPGSGSGISGSGPDLPAAAVVCEQCGAAGSGDECDVNQCCGWCNSSSKELGDEGGGCPQTIYVTIDADCLTDAPLTWPLELTHCCKVVQVDLGGGVTTELFETRYDIVDPGEININGNCTDCSVPPGSLAWEDVDQWTGWFICRSTLNGNELCDPSFPASNSIKPVDFLIIYRTETEFFVFRQFDNVYLQHPFYECNPFLYDLLENYVGCGTGPVSDTTYFSPCANCAGPGGGGSFGSAHGIFHEAP